MNEHGFSRVAINLALVGILVVIGVGAYVALGVGGGDEADGGQATTATVSRGTVSSTVSASGTIASAKASGASFTTGGTVTRILVDVGDHVEKGAILARVDDASAQADVRSASVNASSAAAGVSSAQAGVASAQAGVTAAQLNLEAAQESLQELKDSGTATDSQITEAQAQVASARSQLLQAQGSVTSATAQVAQAQASLSSANAQVVQSRDALDATVLRAPIAGTVVAVNGAVGQDASATSSASSSDSSTAETSGFIVINDLDRLEVSANFSETDTASLRVGQRATVTLNAQPDVEIDGKVVAIAETSTTVNQVVNYGVTIKLKDAPEGVRVGQTVVAQVTTGQAEDVLLVPSAAVTTAGGQTTVTVMQDGQQVSTPVEIGLEGDQFTEITSGLAEGDEVVIATATDSGAGGFPGGGFPGGGALIGGGPGGGGP